MFWNKEYNVKEVGGKILNEPVNEEKLNTVQMYLENNYKDLTLQSYKDAKEVVERYEKSGLLKQKDKDMIQKKMAEFDAKLVHYGHTNVSEFLKERY